MKTKLLTITLATLAALLTACGGGGDTPADTPASTPAAPAPAPAPAPVVPTPEPTPPAPAPAPVPAPTMVINGAQPLQGQFTVSIANGRDPYALYDWYLNGKQIAQRETASINADDLEAGPHTIEARTGTTMTLQGLVVGTEVVATETVMVAPLTIRTGVAYEYSFEGYNLVPVIKALVVSARPVNGSELARVDATLNDNPAQWSFTTKPSHLGICGLGFTPADCARFPNYVFSTVNLPTGKHTAKFVLTDTDGNVKTIIHEFTR